MKPTWWNDHRVEVGAATVPVVSKMICRARCCGYNWVIKGPPLRDWAKLCYADEWVIGERAMSKSKTVEVSLDLPHSVFSALRQDPASFVGEMRLAAAVKWYEMHEVSQAKAAEIAGLSRSEFLLALTRFGVSPLQYEADEVVAEVKGD